MALSKKIEVALLLGSLLLLSGGTMGIAAESKPPWQIEWEATVAVAEKEGEVNAYIFDSGPLTIETRLASI